MSKIIHVICEGQTESSFVNRVLNPYFNPSGKILIPVIVETKNDIKKGKMYKGGIVSFAKTDSVIKKRLPLLEKEDVYVTTMFDYYALPDNFPGFEESKKKSDKYLMIEYLENALYEYYKHYTNSYKFIPYFQLHEFESLVLANLDKLKDVYFDYDISDLYDCMQEIGNPEFVNNGPDTAPSKRIINCISDYDKNTFGVQVLVESNLLNTREKCKHFDDWIKKLEAI